jgi:hypothetical protein
MQAAHVVAYGVPLHVPVGGIPPSDEAVPENNVGGFGVMAAIDGQQIWPGQSLPLVQLFAQLDAQRPPQQTDPLEQSESTMHFFGQLAEAMHTPLTASPGSAFGAVVQQSSPFVVLQSVSAVHDDGHSLVGVQMGFE